ncbi:MAG: type IV toxin-antitoxin system AbiEi family antitoxin domain-containing protein [Candidatus Riflebacteria bacterium]|nr:type IV toxin-antitoxin system AbiEi family antitoxin domain-containing protein [Candidatus Riflebacteria bacterium]
MKSIYKLNKQINNISIPLVTTKEINSYGLHRSILKKLVSAGKISKYSKGIYIKNSSWEDDFQLLQLKYPKGIYSHNTALYLLGYSDRTPALFTMTFPHGYNARSLANEPIEKKQSIKELYNLGVIEIKDFSGNLVKVYELEKTLCDMMRGNNKDIEVITSAFKKYSFSETKNIPKLLKYAKILKVTSKIQPYLEVLL